VYSNSVIVLRRLVIFKPPCLAKSIARKKEILYLPFRMAGLWRSIVVLARGRHASCWPKAGRSPVP
jgi:hypothetical protein